MKRLTPLNSVLLIMTSMLFGVIAHGQEISGNCDCPTNVNEIWSVDLKNFTPYTLNFEAHSCWTVHQNGYCVENPLDIFLGELGPCLLYTSGRCRRSARV